LSTAESSVIPSEPIPQSSPPRRWIKPALFLVSLVLSVAGFLTCDYFYSATVLGAAVSGGEHGFCFSRDPIRVFAFRPDCTCIRPWLGTSYEFKTNSLGFRDETIRRVEAKISSPRVLILGDSGPEGMTDWAQSYVGRLTKAFPQYEFLNSSVEGYSPSNYLNTARMMIREGIDFDEAIVFIDISDAQDEAAFFHDEGASGAVGIANQKRTKSSWYSNLRLNINNRLLLTNDVFDCFEKTLVRLGWYHLDLGHGGNEFDLERSAWTYRAISDSEPYETGYAPLGLEGGISKEQEKMDTLWRELKERNIPITVVVSPWPAQLAHDDRNSREVTIWRDWCAGKCKRFINLFPAFFDAKAQCPKTQPGCWYEKDFIFGDTHYNNTGDTMVADALDKALNDNPVAKRESDATAPVSKSDLSEVRR
jgi:hypothetical protein